MPRITLRKANCGRWRPTAATHTVSGVATSVPIGPHSQVQKITAAMIASGESPVLPL